jgi:hypothetical protein
VLSSDCQLKTAYAPPAKRAVAPEISRPVRANGQVFCLLSMPHYCAGIVTRVSLLSYRYFSCVGNSLYSLSSVRRGTTPPRKPGVPRQRLYRAIVIFW